MSVQRKSRKLTLGKTTLRLLSPRQLEGVAGRDSNAIEPDAGQDSFRACADGVTNSQQNC